VVIIISTRLWRVNFLYPIAPLLDKNLI